jgi:abortive infection bacteriophage resistance protein
MSSGPPPKVPYAKPWLSVGDQVKKLESRGLLVTDHADAEAFLRHINYYRFTGYCLAFEYPRHAFPAGVTFDHVKASCQFDACLRDLFNEALEIIEIDLRTVVAHHFGQKYGAFGHTAPASFHPQFDMKITHSDWLDEIRKESRRSKELFVKHFERRYTQYPDLPVWVVTEIMTFGSMARLIRAMHKADRQNVAAEYGISARVLFSLALHLNYVRNLCAHHARLWDRKWSIQTDLPNEPEWQGANTVSNQRLFSSLLLLRILMLRSPHIKTEADQWRDRVTDLLKNPPAVTNARGLMGLTANWQTHPVWA